MNSDLEWIEQQAMLAWHAAATAAKLPGYDWRIVEIGDALCSVSSTEPSILVNRVLGLGSHGAPTREQLIEIRQLYRDSGISRFFLHVVPDHVGPNREELLTAAGYRRHRGWMKFTRGPGDIREPHTDLHVRRAARADAADFAAIVAPAFDMSPQCEPAIAALADDPDWRLYMTTAGERAAGTGALYLRDGIGYLDFGSTHPDFRCRGGQTALLSARLRDAFDQGCHTVVTMTGEAVPGDPQHSYGNILKAGFAEAYLRENWIPAES
jgi:GNAT superfamily N-acetyltransferase